METSEIGLKRIKSLQMGSYLSPLHISKIELCTNLEINHLKMPKSPYEDIQPKCFISLRKHIYRNPLIFVLRNAIKILFKIGFLSRGYVEYIC